MNTTIERRALYNLLRMNWLNDPTLTVEPWQVEDYRTLSFASLFEQLNSLDVYLDRTSFIAYANECDSPEELTEQLVGDRQLKAKTEDRVYLLVFELWRRLLSEKPSLSILCNELDHQIFLYDRGELSNSTDLPDALANFIGVLDENVDEGIPPGEAFQLIKTYLANDIETFLYDFISEQIDEENDSYARDLLDDLHTYVEGNKWFELLHARLLRESSHKIASKFLSQLVEEHLQDNDLEFNLELLSLMADIGDFETFQPVLHQTVTLLQTEEDFQDLLHICEDYCHRLDQEDQKQTLQAILQKRSNLPLQQALYPNDPDLVALLKILASNC